LRKGPQNLPQECMAFRTDHGCKEHHSLSAVIREIQVDVPGSIRAWGDRPVGREVVVANIRGMNKEVQVFGRGKTHRTLHLWMLSHDSPWQRRCNGDRLILRSLRCRSLTIFGSLV